MRNQQHHCLPHNRTLYAKQLPSSRSITSSGAAAAATPTAPPLLPAKHSISSSLTGLGTRSASCSPSSSAYGDGGRAGLSVYRHLKQLHAGQQQHGRQ